jgi:hypothetical protein
MEALECDIVAEKIKIGRSSIRKRVGWFLLHKMCCFQETKRPWTPGIERGVMGLGLAQSFSRGMG